MLLLGWGSRLQHERPAQIRPRGVKNEKKSSSWSFKLFRVRRETKVRLQILNKGEWRREKNKKKGRQRDTMKPSAPRKNYFRGGGWNKSGHRGTNKVMKAWRIFRERWHISFICERERERLLIKAPTYNTLLEHESLFLLVFFPQLYWKSYGT